MEENYIKVICNIFLKRKQLKVCSFFFLFVVCAGSLGTSLNFHLQICCIMCNKIYNITETKSFALILLYIHTHDTFIEHEKNLLKQTK